MVIALRAGFLYVVTTIWRLFHRDIGRAGTIVSVAALVLHGSLLLMGVVLPWRLVTNEDDVEHREVQDERVVRVELRLFIHC